MTTSPSGTSSLRGEHRPPARLEIEKKTAHDLLSWRRRREGASTLQNAEIRARVFILAAPLLAVRAPAREVRARAPREGLADGLPVPELAHAHRDEAVGSHMTKNVEFASLSERQVRDALEIEHLAHVGVHARQKGIP